MAYKKVRNMKVYYQYSRWDKKDMVSTIRLKGQWLKELGFDVGDPISVACENGKIIITPKIEEEE